MSATVAAPHSGAARPKARIIHRAFLLTWTLAVAATGSAFVVHLALRGRVVEANQELAKARAEQARLREVQRVLALEAASYKTPERVETVARSLLGMAPPTDDRIVMMNGVKQSAAPASSVPRPAGSVVAQDRPAHP